MSNLHRQILQGDVMDKIKEIPDESIDCVITSPPYWGLRDYQLDGQWGLEKDFHQFLDRLDSLMNEIRRVMKKTATCWVNLGDTYASKPVGKFTHSAQLRNRNMTAHKSSGTMDKTKSGIREKSRFGIPERFYIRCIDNGWIARNYIPWVKANSMPQSTQDRFTNKWEPIFFFAKERKYYFNLDAVREKLITEVKKTKIRKNDGIQNSLDIFGKSKKIHEKYENMPQSNVVRLHREREGNPNNTDDHVSKYPKRSNGGRLGKYRNDIRKQNNTLGADGKPKQTYKDFNQKWQEQINSGKYGEDKENRARVVGYMNSTHGGNANGKNPGDVFNINPRPFPEAHFATFPLDLPEKILKCACPPKGIVLDPFFGSGTVGFAAEMLDREWVGIEKKQEYIDIARDRLNPKMLDKLT